ncbi:Hypothetical predicted protein [Cloeon dipterum]|uniref:Uncharacterized protein n=1 Tax=Cloeon dipterum TaxID=197152 RepID=A0A8S1CVC0_9INSE|nr:Hypothetical predicted protein [Cloeon dipterum]
MSQPDAKKLEFQAPVYSASDKFFNILEGKFAQYGIEGERDRYLTLASAVAYDDIPPVAAQMLETTPEDKPYSTLNAAILNNLRHANY